MMLMFVYNQSSKQSLKCKQYNNNMTENIYQENIKEKTSLDDHWSSECLRIVWEP